MNEALRATLGTVAALLEGTRRPWWIIGSAAVVLHGAATDVSDVDVLLDPADAIDVLRRLGVEPRAGEPDGRFSSAVFHRWTGASLPVELMGGLHVAVDGEWRRVAPRGRAMVEAAGRPVFVPTRDELHDLLVSFGREKDRARAALLSPRTCS